LTAETFLLKLWFIEPRTLCLRLGAGFSGWIS